MNAHGEKLITQTLTVFLMLGYPIKLDNIPTEVKNVLQFYSYMAILGMKNRYL